MNAITEGLNPTAGGGINNPMDIRTEASNAWVGKRTQPGAAFEAFDFMWQGYRAGIKTLQTLYNSGKTTLTSIIETYAPACDNNDCSSYIAAVSNLSGIAPDVDLQPYINDQASMTTIVTAMTGVEQGSGFSVNSADIATAWTNL